NKSDVSVWEKLPDEEYEVKEHDSSQEDEDNYLFQSTDDSYDAEEESYGTSNARMSTVRDTRNDVPIQQNRSKSKDRQHTIVQQLSFVTVDQKAVTIIVNDNEEVNGISYAEEYLKLNTSDLPSNLMQYHFGLSFSQRSFPQQQRIDLAQLCSCLQFTKKKSSILDYV
ncbi:unnamed protein product, partial [Didymodactylos carnosus]